MKGTRDLNVQCGVHNKNNIIRGVIKGWAMRLVWQLWAAETNILLIYTYLLTYLLHGAESFLRS